MLVVVEGPSASGKSTWARRVAPDCVVAENQGLVAPEGDDDEVASFWAEANVGRWQAAEDQERSGGVAVCDTDPFKLHYHYCLFRIGAVPLDRVRAGWRACRVAVSARRLGLADLILCELPPDDVLTSRKESDPTRRRGNFARHRRLGAPLGEWYGALEALDAGRVTWGFPPELPDTARRERFDLDLFDAWMGRLGLG